MRVLEPRLAYELLAPEYDRSPNALIALEERMMTPLLPDLGGRTVVDVAAGTGRWAARCALAGARTIAVDFCYRMLKPGMVQADATRLPIRDASADLAICAFALGYAPDAFRELRRIVKRGGMILASDVHPDALRRGWTRTFRHKGDVIEVAHRPYSIDDLRVRGVRMTRLMEPRLGEPERAIFEHAGCPERFPEASRHPAIFVAQWIRE
jgi:malonyl-CoA O-methyltransferase